MTLNPAINLSAEQQAALQKRADDASLTLEEYLAQVVIEQATVFVEADFYAASQRLILASKSLPYEQRLAIIAQVENALTQA
jgi:hypothetical protein